MHETIVVLKNFQFEKPTPCLCEPQTYKINKKDRLYILGDAHFNEIHGWHIPLQRNQDVRFHMFLDDLEELYKQKVVCPEMDLELAANYHQFKVDQALDDKNYGLFIKHTNLLQEWSEFLPPASTPKEQV
ncbi:hypothetical protein [Halobacillus mangrovi]|uniref:Uncharacterized protein n=1 Tax=Halobacillus mangrovi TaxID=402384 RepID=A0A1W5ZTQ2_9BACI|nr:hypothetical protein [Halobacillus mangrovi]ARI76641.1 hypothetical protein HM131_07220 [Halobacillus mangrovi]